VNQQHGTQNTERGTHLLFYAHILSTTCWKLCENPWKK